MSEQCAPCNATEPFTVTPADDLALCRAHFNMWLDRYVGNPDAPDPPCSVHLIGDES